MLALMVVTWGFLLRVRAAGGHAVVGAGEGMQRFRSGVMVVVPCGRGARHLGLLALRSASGVGLPAARAGGRAPTAFNRAGEKLQATGGELPRVSHGVVPDAGTGSLSPSSGRKV